MKAIDKLGPNEETNEETNEHEPFLSTETELNKPCVSLGSCSDHKAVKSCHKLISNAYVQCQVVSAHIFSWFSLLPAKLLTSTGL